MGTSKSLFGSSILRTEQREQHTMFLKKSKTQDFQTKKHDREYVLLQNKEEIKISGEKPLIRQ